MNNLAIWIFSGFLTYYKPKWEKDKEKRKWAFWEECEEMAAEMGHTTDIVKIPKRKKKPPRKKHRY